MTENEKIDGTVVSIDDDGNLISDIVPAALDAALSKGEQVRIECDEHETFGIHQSLDDMPELTFAAVLGDGGLMLAVKGERATDLLGIRVGTKVTVTW